MDFESNETQQLLKSTAATVAEKYGPEYWRERERTHDYPDEFYQELANAGFLGMLIPQEYGGEGMSMLDTCIGIEALAANGVGPAASWFMVLTPIFGGISVERQGTEEQKEKYLPEIASGDIAFSLGLTEPGAGTNTLNLETTAERDGDEFVINGQKTWITNADRSDAIVLLTRTTPLSEVDSRTEGLTFFIVDLPVDGIEVSPIPKVGFNYTNSCDVFIDGLRVHEDDVLGEVDNGWRDIADTILTERIAHTAGAVGSGELALKTATEYANEREVFDQPIGSHQGIQFPLAKLKARLETARILNHKAAWQYETDREYIAAANMAKYVGMDSAFSAADQAMQTHGGVGYSEEYDVERWWRELRLLRIAPVSQQMALNYVGQHVLDLPRSY